MKTPEHIEKREIFGNCTYQTSCDCGCDAKFSMKIDTEWLGSGILEIAFKGVKCSRWYGDSWWAQLKDRIKTVVKYLFTGYMEVEQSVVFDNSEHVRDVSTVLNHLADKMEKFNEY